LLVDKKRIDVVNLQKFTLIPCIRLVCKIAFHIECEDDESLSLKVLLLKECFAGITAGLLGLAGGNIMV
tara:strand:- start:844 stop:1050 length:207 start_codon:yes stop_codon:yes gene_type:complete